MYQLFQRARIVSVVVVLLSLCGLSMGPAALNARAQGASYCNITRITTRSRTNAVEITVQADGLMDVQWDTADFANIEAWSRGRRDEIWKPVSVLPFRITNARSQVGPFTDVGIYPASHVEVSIPSDAREGIGVDLRVVLFREATPVSVQTPYGIELPGEPPLGPTVSVTLSQDRTRLLFLITSDRKVFSSVERAGPPPGAPRTLDVTATDGAVSIHALNADLRDVLREIARKTGRDVVADGVLERTVSLALPDTPVDEALEALAMACGLTLDRSGGVIRAADGRANSLPAYEQGGFETIPLRHVRAASLRASLPDVLLRYLHLDERQNALTVFGPKDIIRKVREDVAVLDRPVPQIAVEARIVEFSSTDERNRLLRVDHADDGSVLASDMATGDITFDSVSSLPDGFEARLNALVRAGKARLRAQPHMLVRNGETAKLFVGQQKYIKVAEYNPWEDVDYVKIMGVDLGVSLRVTPWTGDGEQVILDVAPEVSTITEREPRTGLPTVFTRNASTTLLLRTGETAVIGGLSEDQPEHRRHRIPILSDLPLIGGLFRTTEKVRARHDLTLFVTARVLRDAAPDGASAPAAPSNGDTR